MSRINIKIGGLAFRLIIDRKIHIGKEFLPFLSEKDYEDIKVEYVVKDEVKDYKIVNDNDFNYIVVNYHPDIAHHFDGLRGCFMYIPMHQILLAHNNFFLHASFIISEYGGLLFSGDSGAGKSTQAQLWKEYMRSTIINGDRTIISKEDHIWRAYGSPYAGSSKYYVNQNEQIRAIILLNHGVDNSISRLSYADAFKRLFMQISIDHTDKNQIDKTCNLLSDLINDIPIYLLSCTPDKRAVEVLSNVLKEDAHGK